MQTSAFTDKTQEPTRPPLELGEDVLTAGEPIQDPSAWERVMLARHPQRPYTQDYLQGIFDSFLELKGDRAGTEDSAILGGVAHFCGNPVMVIGHRKGRKTQERMACHFGMALPGGYRKALRLIRLAERFRLPLITFIDTPGAHPGVEAETHGQAEAIASNLLELARLTVPVIAVVIGEGGSGGALALGVANKILMLENAVYSVISPEGCAAILWRDPSAAAVAAEKLGLTAAACLKMGVADEVIREPEGGAHRAPAPTMEALKRRLKFHLELLMPLSGELLRLQRYRRFRHLGAYTSCLGEDGTDGSESQDPAESVIGSTPYGLTQSFQSIHPVRA